MLTVEDRLNKLPGVRLVLIILWLLAWIGVGQAADSVALPAKDWNLRQLERLKTVERGSPELCGHGRQPQQPGGLCRRTQSSGPRLRPVLRHRIGGHGGEGHRGAIRSFLYQLRPEPVHLPFLTVVGNHDLGKDLAPDLYRQIFGPDYYAFQIKDAAIHHRRQ